MSRQRIKMAMQQKITEFVVAPLKSTERGNEEDESAKVIICSFTPTLTAIYIGVRCMYACV